MTFFFFILTFFVGSSAIETQEQAPPREVTITIDMAHPTHVPDFAIAMGGGIDGHDGEETNRGQSHSLLQKVPVHYCHGVAPNVINCRTDPIVAAMLSSGLKPLSYRLRTELGVEAWHWNPNGRWSDTQHQQGYWTSSTHARVPITKSYGYRLPRRGDTLDEANSDSYSHLDDGNTTTFWKSNPYLSSRYTRESDAQHPQWILIDFGKPVLINAARLHWKDPYARKFRIQYSCGGDLYFGHDRDWHDFPKGKFTKATGGSPMLDLGMPRTFFGKAIPVRFIRIVMTEGSGTSPAGSLDPRDHMGYALGEVECGFLESGKFCDKITHRPDQRQTVIYVSSTDPWHRASDRDEKTEQPGLDLVARSGLGNHQPILWSVPFFYDTPENAAAEVDFLKKRGYLFPSQRLELGEEPDGQRVDPKEVAELYAQTSRKIHQVHPEFSLGGLSFVTIDVNRGDLIYRVDKRPWLRHFFKQLQKKGARKNFQFLTFEWYPFDDLLLPAEPLLIKQPQRLKEAVTRIRHGGIPSTMPLMISEYGYSVFSGEPEVTLAAALLNADIAAQFLLLGGTTSYLYGYEPNKLECAFDNSWGNLMMFLQNENGGMFRLEPLPTYYAAQLLTQQWGPASGGPCNVYPATTNATTKKGDPFVTAYFLSANNRGKKNLSLLLVNKNPKAAYRLKCRWNHASRSHLAKEFEETWECYSYSPAQYQWQVAGAQGHPLLNQPPLKSFCQAHLQSGSHRLSLEFQKNGETITIAPWSITVLTKKEPGSSLIQAHADLRSGSSTPRPNKN